MNAGSVDENVFERIEQAIMQIGWLGQRQFMQLLSDDRFVTPGSLLNRTFAPSCSV